MPSSSLQALLARASRGARARPRRRRRGDADARTPLGRAAARRRARRPRDARGSVAAAGRSRSAPPPRSDVRPTRSATPSSPGRLATLWRLHGTSGVGARRSVAGDRAARTRAQAGRGRARARARSDSPTTSWRTATAASATRPSCASTSPRPRRRCTRPAIGAISRSCTRCRASCSRRSANTTRRWRALRHAERLASHGAGRRRPGDRVQQSGRRDDDGAPLRAGARAGRAERGAARRPAARDTGWRSRSPPSARSACASAISTARKTRCTARSRCAARFSFTRRRAPCSTRSRRST